MILDYKTYIESVATALRYVEITNKDGGHISPDDALSNWCSLTSDIKQKKKNIFFIGNGASAMMASHMAADANKNGGVKSVAFNDSALLTTISNDICYEESFAFPLERFSESSDMLVAISSSGNSPNIIKAIEFACRINLTVITLSGLSPDNNSRSMGDINYYVPADTYGIVESAHQIILHCWLDNFIIQQNNNKEKR